MTFSLTTFVDCFNCDTTQEVEWVFPERVQCREDITDDDVEETRQTITCTECGYQWPANYEGWHSHDDAG